jgi:hypothetical protein
MYSLGEAIAWRSRPLNQNNYFALILSAGIAMRKRSAGVRIMSGAEKAQSNDCESDEFANHVITPFVNLESACSEESP